MTNKVSLASKVESLNPWYQQFEIKGVKTTNPGFMNERAFGKISSLLPRGLTRKIVLDLGCNAGFVSFKVAGLGAKVYGFDKDEHYIDQANFVMKHSSVPKVRFIIGDVESLAINAYSPKLIIALSIIYHLSNPEAFINKLCNEHCDLLVSFRLSNYKDYLDYFSRKVTSTVDYGRKRAFFFKC